jgi:hypothetical protein
VVETSERADLATKLASKKRQDWFQKNLIGDKISDLIRAESHWRSGIFAECAARVALRHPIVLLVSASANVVDALGLSHDSILVLPTTIAKIEAGDRAVRIDEATAIAHVFEVSLDSLLGRKAGVVDDPAYPIRALRDKAMKDVRDVGTISRSFRDTLVDVRGLEFDGRETVESEGERAVKGLGEAQRAL